MKKAILYARVASGTDASAQEGFEVQFARCTTRASASGYDVVGQFQDFGSGNDPRRPGLKRLLETANDLRDEGVVVLVADSSRLARSPEIKWAVDKVLARLRATVEVVDA